MELSKTTPGLPEANGEDPHTEKYADNDEQTVDAKDTNDDDMNNAEKTNEGESNPDDLNGLKEEELKQKPDVTRIGGNKPEEDENTETVSNSQKKVVNRQSDILDKDETSNTDEEQNSGDVAASCDEKMDISENGTHFYQDNKSDSDNFAVIHPEEEHRALSDIGQEEGETDDPPRSCFFAFWHRICLGLNPFGRPRSSMKKVPTSDVGVENINTDIEYLQEISEKDAQSDGAATNQRPSSLASTNQMPTSSSLASITSMESRQLLTSISITSQPKTETSVLPEPPKTANPGFITSLREKISNFFTEVEYDSVSECSSSVSYVDHATQMSKTLTSSRMSSSSSYHTMKSGSGVVPAKVEEITPWELEDGPHPKKSEEAPYPEHTEETVALPSCNIGGYTFYTADEKRPGGEEEAEGHVTDHVTDQEVQQKPPRRWERPRRYTRKRLFRFVKLVRRYTRRNTE